MSFLPILAQLPNEWVKVSLRVAVTTALHPLDLSKTLMQIGYEPVAPIPGKSILGSAVMILPNVFSYTSYLRKVHGFDGLYTGLTPKLIGLTLATLYSDILADKLGLKEQEQEAESSDDDAELLKQRYVASLKRDLAVHTISAAIMHPFHVVAVRQMAQLVGNEAKYNSTFGSLRTIVREEGLLGLFSGFIPKLIGDLGCVLLAGTTTYWVHRYVIAEREQRAYFGSFNNFIWAGLMYPFQLTSICVIVSKSGLAAGTPPNMPVYSDWTQAFRMLRNEGEHKRGSSLFFRYVKKSAAGYQRRF